MSSPLGYVGFESPEQQYYQVPPVLPLSYTGAQQIRQFGVGQPGGTGRAPTITSALANVPAAMATAENSSNTAAIGLYVVTQNDLFDYHPYNAPGQV
jgi:hypothetical protein